MRIVPGEMKKEAYGNPQASKYYLVSISLFRCLIAKIETNNHCKNSHE
jgi:hypothetical protein